MALCMRDSKRFWADQIQAGDGAKQTKQHAWRDVLQQRVACQGKDSRPAFAKEATGEAAAQRDEKQCVDAQVRRSCTEPVSELLYRNSFRWT